MAEYAKDIGAEAIYNKINAIVGPAQDGRRMRRFTPDFLCRDAARFGGRMRKFIDRLLPAAQRAAGRPHRAVAILIVPVTMQMISRFTGLIPAWIWTEEMARFLFIWMVMLGAMIGVRDGRISSATCGPS